MMISVCMAIYNGEEFIKDQIDSILPQLNEDDELIVSDDGSSDKTLSIIKSYQDKRIKIYHSNQRNIIKNFENALTKAKGDIVFLSDQDDIWYPEKVETVLFFLRDYDLVFSNASVFESNREISTRMYSKEQVRTGLLRNFIKNNYIGATMAFNRKVLSKALPFPNHIYMHDIWLAMIAEVYGKTHFIEKPLIYYRRHGNNASETGEKSSNTIFKKIAIRIKLAYSLLLRML